jgi:hypothetical protein
MKQLLLASLILFLAGCAISAKGTSPDEIYMVEGDQYKIAECISDKLSEKWETKYMSNWWNTPLFTDPIKHYVKKTANNTYEVSYTGVWTIWHDPIYYVKLTQVDNVILIERFSFYTGIYKGWPKEAIAACI